MSDEPTNDNVCPVALTGPAPWYRHPILAVIVGLGANWAMANVLLGFAPGLGPAVTYAVFAVPASLIGGFIVGAIAGRRGMLWASVTSGLFVLAMALFFSITPQGFDPMSFVRLVPFGILPVLLSAVGGKLGECSCRCRV